MSITVRMSRRSRVLGFRFTDSTDGPSRSDEF